MMSVDGINGDDCVNGDIAAGTEWAAPRRFWLIPFRRSDPPVEDPHRAEPASRGGDKREGFGVSRILLCNEDDSFCTTLAKRLAEIGYSVAGTCHTSDEILDRARTLSPDVVLADVKIPGSGNYIDILRSVQTELPIPVIFVTAETRKTIIAQALEINPYGYIVMPCNDIDLTVAIEVALSRVAFETTRVPPNGGCVPPVRQTGEIRTIGQQSKAMLLDGFFSDLILFLYTKDVNKEPIFRYSIDDAIHNGERVIYAYYEPCIGSRFLAHISSGQLHRYPLHKKGGHNLQSQVASCCDSISKSQHYIALKFLFDFSEFESFDDVLQIKKYVLQKRDLLFPISGVFAFDVEEITEEQTRELSRGMGRVIISSGEETTLSFTTSAFSSESLDIVPHEMVDEVVKKSLEAIVLSYLWDGNTGSEILHRIHEHFNVLLPQSTVYSLLHDLEERGIITSETHGKMRVYSPSRKGRDYIQKKLYEIQVIYRHIFWGLLRETADQKRPDQ